MTKRYAVIPGPVHASYDGGPFDWIGAGQLIRLFKVNPAECVILAPLDRIPDGLIPLRPQQSGHYVLPGGEL